MHVRFSSFIRRDLAAFGALMFIGLLAGAEAMADDFVGDPYPLEKCFCDEFLDDLAVIIDFEGREIRFCKEECRSDFESAHHTYIPIIDERIINQQRDAYPLETCVVCGKAMEESGGLDEVCLNRLFRICGYDCQEKLKKDPAKHFAKLDRAVVEKQRKSYPLKRCIVSGKPLGKTAVDYVVANYLVRLADADQIESFNELPGKYLAELRKAMAKDGD